MNPRAGLVLVAIAMMTISACAGSGLASPEGHAISASPEPSRVHFEPTIDGGATNDEAEVADGANFVSHESPFVSYSVARYIASIPGASSLDEYLRGESEGLITWESHRVIGVLEFDEATNCSFLVQVADADEPGLSTELPDRIPLAWEHGATDWNRSRQELSYWAYPDWLLETEPRAVFNTVDPVWLWLLAVSDQRPDRSVPTEFLIPPRADCGGEVFYVFSAGSAASTSD